MSCLYPLAIRTEIGDLLRVTSFARFEGNSVTWTSSRYTVQDWHEPQLRVKDENVGWKHTYNGCSHAGFERIGSRSGYNPVEDIYILTSFIL